MKYFIHKSSRLPEWPYAGPTCEKAGVQPGRVYDLEQEAFHDAALMSEVNPVGFSVASIEDEFFQRFDVVNPENLKLFYEAKRVANTGMFSSIKKILSAFDKGILTNHGLDIALEDYGLFGGDGEMAIESGQMLQSAFHSSR